MQLVLVTLFEIRVLSFTLPVIKLRAGKKPASVATEIIELRRYVRTSS
jgi:hypothetical protein